MLDTGKRIERLAGQRQIAQARQLELAEPRLLVLAPLLAKVQSLDEKIAMPLEKHVRCKLHDRAIVAPFQGLAATDRFDDDDPRFTHADDLAGDRRNV